ncbi:ABC transporter ATP-binding protein [Anabaena cylindrica FACHB-243]|uniref:Xenobiotic-transporting ATPase n=1 Tax=Anabaena cylindrica (strain ATCC 27899 / PCC 7122) TaxID=272123 RepID=K9Z9K9_ANACC|nr:MULTISPECIES: heterocyst formation ABC transporter subunit HepA [Anabaena]AFZ55883.1 Xenobiotic-transporting ATPase [Anabaena cylindrica PCC 7122]MBD2421306.1 ABC transporter ATP-binding protein [Anabaena cylindrica FACHB-243]MBY5280876.1 ABC transporter ATP-binding protein [Anabaena sp. CCAP 1446/1C]MBY5310000.1 ABC transporter ATP-binding protein [Anabaena sp. CCAP 1446/1C]MCM2406638.1 ABC transporter ATP-binding protein/permease [Anabaena sp. CCAP 1446/1C]
MNLKIPSSTLKILQATNFWQNYHLILREFKHFRLVASLAIVFSALAASFEGFGLGFLLIFLQSLTTPGSEPVKTGISWFDIFILGINASATERLYRVSALIIITTCMRASFNYMGQICIQFSEINLVDNLRKRIFEQLAAQSLSYFGKKSSGELINTLTNEMERIRQIFGGMAFLVARGLTLIVYSISLFVLSWQLSIVSVLLFSLLAVGLSTLNKQIRERSFAITKANDNFTSRSLEFIEGIRTVHAFSTQEFEQQRYYQASKKIVNTWKSVYWISLLVKPLAESLSTMILISMIIVALVTGLMEVSSLLTFFFVLFRLVPMTQDLNGVIAFLSTQAGAVENIKDLLKTEDKNYFQNGHIQFHKLQRAIEIIAVNFGYEPNKRVLKDITLTIEKGQMIALVGASGGGKSTLADLIARFYDPIEGKIFIDGINLREFEIDSLRRKMAIVSQKTFIFNASIRNNIAYGALAVTETEIIEAARLANALEFIEKLPQGLDTVIGADGIQLSGGQQQRIAIARALIRNPEILILDEPTSALDSITEQVIQELLEKFTVGRTVIVIAHRLSTIAKADKVVVIEQGQIVEQGAYQELRQQRGKFWQYYQIQNEVR